MPEVSQLVGMDNASPEGRAESPHNQCPLVFKNFILFSLYGVRFLNQHPVLRLQSLDVQLRVLGDEGKEQDRQVLLSKTRKEGLVPKSSTFP